MAAENRQNLATTLAALSAVVDLSELKAVLTNFIDSMAMNRDVQNTITVAGAGTTNVSFSGYDTIYVSTSYSCTLNIQNINDGEVKFLHVNKTAGIEVLFTGATEQSLDHSYITSTLTDVVYMVYKKHFTSVVVIPMVKDLDISSYYTKVEADAKYAIPTYLGDKTAWDLTSSSFTADGSWHTLNLSGIIPTSAKMAMCRMRVRAVTGVDTNAYFYFRKTGYVNDFNRNGRISYETSSLREYDVWLPVTNSTVDYKISVTTGNLYSVEMVFTIYI